jgi:hypothetical protein
MERRIFVSNAFSLSMLTSFPANLRVNEVGLEDVKEFLQENSFISAVGHQSTADVMSRLLGIQIPFNRIQIQLKEGDVVIVFQLLTRLEEGKILTEDELSKLQFKFLVVVNDTPVTVFVGNRKRNRKRKSK